MLPGRKCSSMVLICLFFLFFEGKIGEKWSIYIIYIYLHIFFCMHFCIFPFWFCFCIYNLENCFWLTKLHWNIFMLLCAKNWSWSSLLTSKILHHNHYHPQTRIKRQHHLILLAVAQKTAWRKISPFPRTHQLAKNPFLVH